MPSLQEIANADVSAGLSEHNVIDLVKQWSIDLRRDYAKQQSLPYEVAILNVTGELNVGNIIRTASLCGARRVHVLGRRKYDSRGTVGSENYIDVRRYNLMENETTLDAESVVSYFHIKDLFPVFIEQWGTASTEFSMPTVEATVDERLTPCFVFGNEGRGIPWEIMRNFYPNRGLIMHLNQLGVIRSFNVGSAAAIVLYEVMKWYKS